MRCFKLRTSFNRVESRSIRKISLSFRFMAASRKKLFHISVKCHKAEVKLFSLYEFSEAVNGIANCKKIFCPSFMFHHFTINCIWLMLFLHELKQVLVLVKQFTSASSMEMFQSNRYYSHGSSFSKHLNSTNEVVHLARCATQDLYNTDASDMNKSQSFSLPSLNFLSADLTWLDMLYI